MTITQAIKGVFSEMDSFYEYDTYSENECRIDVSYGDWKHDHLCLDHYMRKNGFEKVNEEIYHEDGSDCYSSYHYYKYNNK